MNAFLDGECLEIAERVVVSPTCGRFTHCANADLDSGTRVQRGQVVALIDVHGSEPVPVVSHFTGRMMAFLAEVGERVVAGQPIAWLRTD